MRTLVNTTDQCALKMTIHQSVEIKVDMRNHYSLIMNLNAINKTLALVNKNIQFSNTRNPDLIKAFKLVKIHVFIKVTN